MTTTHSTTIANPRKIDDLRHEALRIRKCISDLEAEWHDAIIRHMRKERLRRTPTAIRREINDLDERLTLIVAEYLDRRRI